VRAARVGQACPQPTASRCQPRGRATQAPPSTVPTDRVFMTLNPTSAVLGMSQRTWGLGIHAYQVPQHGAGGDPGRGASVEDFTSLHHPEPRSSSGPCKQDLASPESHFVTADRHPGLGKGHSHAPLPCPLLQLIMWARLRACRGLQETLCSPLTLQPEGRGAGECAVLGGRCCALRALQKARACLHPSTPSRRGRIIRQRRGRGIPTAATWFSPRRRWPSHTP